jgi:hypothetical protein
MIGDDDVPSADERLSPTDKLQVKSLISIIDFLQIELKKRALTCYDAARKYTFLGRMLV